MAGLFEGRRQLPTAAAEVKKVGRRVSWHFSLGHPPVFRRRRGAICPERSETPAKRISTIYITTSWAEHLTVWAEHHLMAWTSPSIVGLLLELESSVVASRVNRLSTAARVNMHDDPTKTA